MTRTRRTPRIDIKKMLVDHLGGKCKDCGLTTDWIEVYDFHHPPGKKRHDLEKNDGNISQMIQKYKCRCPGMFCLKIEVECCDLLCSNCHRIRHAKAHDETTEFAERDIGKCRTRRTKSLGFTSDTKSIAKARFMIVDFMIADAQMKTRKAAKKLSYCKSDLCRLCKTSLAGITYKQFKMALLNLVVDGDVKQIVPVAKNRGERYQLSGRRSKHDLRK